MVLFSFKMTVKQEKARAHILKAERKEILYHSNYMVAQNMVCTFNPNSIGGGGKIPQFS